MVVYPRRVTDTKAEPAKVANQEPKDLTIDFHIDIPWQLTKQGFYKLAENQVHRPLDKHVDTDFPRMKMAGLNGAFAALYISDGMQDGIGPQQAKMAITRQINMLKAQTGAWVVDNATDARGAVSLGEVPLFMGLEGGRLLDNDLNWLHDLRRHGVRYLTLTHNKNTDWADSATDSPKHCGITSAGKKIIKECEKIGVYIDVSHASRATTMSALFMSEKPVLATHSGAYKLVKHDRNLHDEEIYKIAETGGVIGVPFAKKFVGRLWKGVAEHIDHMVQLVGPNHVAVGSDLDGAAMVDGCWNVCDWKRIVLDELSDMGYSDDLVGRIAGENILRLME